MLALLVATAALAASPKVAPVPALVCPAGGGPVHARVRTDVPVEIAKGVRTFPGWSQGRSREVEVLADAPSVRFAVTEGPASLTLSASRAALDPVITRPVALALAPAPSAAGPGPLRVDLAPGAPVRILASDPATGAVRVSTLSARVSASGWVPGDAVGVLWTPCAFPEDLHDVELVPAPDDTPPPAVELRDAPNGAVLALVAPRGEFMARALTKVAKTKAGSWQPITLSDEGVRVSGWVRADRVRALSRAHVYRTWTEAWDRDQRDAGRVALVAGTPLRARTGQVFGTLAADGELALVGSDASTVTVRVVTDWGPVEGIADCPRRDTGPDGLRCLP